MDGLQDACCVSCGSRTYNELPKASNGHRNGHSPVTPAILNDLPDDLKLMDVLRQLWDAEEQGWSANTLRGWLSAHDYTVERSTIPGRWVWKPERPGPLWAFKS